MPSVSLTPREAQELGYVKSATEILYENLSGDSNTPIIVSFPTGRKEWEHTSLLRRKEKPHEIIYSRRVFDDMKTFFYTYKIPMNADLASIFAKEGDLKINAILKDLLSRGYDSESLRTKGDNEKYIYLDIKGDKKTVKLSETEMPDITPSKKIFFEFSDQNPNPKEVLSIYELNEFSIEKAIAFYETLIRKLVFQI